MTAKIRPKRGIVVSLNLIKIVKTLVCRICRTPNEKSYAKVISCIDPETTRWTSVIWPFCHHHLTESRLGFKAFVLKHKLPLKFIEGIPELIYDRGAPKKD